MRYPTNYIAIAQGFTSKHRGIDLGWNSKNGGQNQPIYAVADGEVIYYKNQLTGGYTLHIYHKELGIVTEYGHLLKGSILVKVGQKVKQGQQIAKMGRSGIASGCHLHFGIYLGSKIDYKHKEKFVNPIPYLNAYKNQVIGSDTAKKYNVLKTKVVTGVPDEPLNVRDLKNKVVAKLYNGQECEYYGKSGTKAIVDNIRTYTTIAKYLK